MAGLLAACGGDETLSGSGTSTTPTAKPPATAGALSVLAQKSDIAVGGGKIIRDQRVVVTQPTAGQFVGFSAICTHQGCVLAKVSDGTIICGCHGAAYSITDGSVTKGPATKPLPRTEIKVEGDDIKLV
jgi:Rieske Fe-S protein